MSRKSSTRPFPSWVLITLISTVSIFFSSCLAARLISSSVIHWPIAFPPGGLTTAHPDPAKVKEEFAVDPSISIVETWTAMTKLPKSKVKSIGVSNFSVEHIKAIAEATGVWPVSLIARDLC